MTDADQKALTCAIEAYRARGRRDAAYIDEKIEREGFRSAGSFASYSAQMHSLRLAPWMYPPALIDEADIERTLAAGDGDMHGKFVAAQLVVRLREHGISKYHPDPMAALDAARKRDAA
jgi:hypothetical protein